MAATSGPSAHTIIFVRTLLAMDRMQETQLGAKPREERKSTTQISIPAWLGRWHMRLIATLKHLPIGAGAGVLRTQIGRRSTLLLMWVTPVGILSILCGKLATHNCAKRLESLASRGEAPMAAEIKGRSRSK